MAGVVIDSKPRFQLGQRVTSKQTGLPMTGTIVGVIWAPWRVFAMKRAGKLRHERWFQLYPDWIEKWLYEVQFDEAHRTVSFEEWRDGSPKEWPRSKINRDMYEILVNPEFGAQYPEDDLELLF